MTTDDDAKATTPPATDPNALVQWVLRESYLQTTEDLRYYAEKVRSINQKKKAIRDYLNALREADADVRSSLRGERTDPCAEDSSSREAVEQAIKERAQDHLLDDAARELCIPGRVPPTSVTTLDGLAAEVRAWEERLNTVGDDAQLANIDLQNILQKQQQALQMMSNISKVLHDTATSVIRKIGG
jgi:hypothetical protein